MTATAQRAAASDALDEGTLRFTVESRLLRELGERLVKQPEVALVELVKNSYDADARLCQVSCTSTDRISVTDDGHGMTLDEFKNGWMRIGTSAKEKDRLSRDFGRVITGEKGIGRFAVRFLGTDLSLRSVAYDEARAIKTVLVATFHWPSFDNNEDLGKVAVPYSLHKASVKDHLGTTLTITQLRTPVARIDLDAVRTATVSVVTPYRTLLRDAPRTSPDRSRSTMVDGGFTLSIQPAPDTADDGDVARAILDCAVLRGVLTLSDERVTLHVYRRGVRSPVLKINDRFPNTIGTLYADIRFLPQRKGTFVDLPVDGRRAKTWVRKHCGVAVFDRAFRVLPYGAKTDDWLELAADTARRAREPRSSLALKHFPMNEVARPSTQLNYMLRLPHPEQLVGVVQIEGQRSVDQRKERIGLVAAADREGFIENEAFQQLWDVVRGAVEAIASEDRELQQDQEREQREAELRALKSEARAAIREIEANPDIRTADKHRIIKQLADTQALAEQYEQRTREREATLEIMSLLGVVAGFMTHEFGVALDELEKCQRKLLELAKRDPFFKSASDAVSGHVSSLQEFVTYSQGYIRGASLRPTRPYPVRPRVQQVVRIFGKYASARRIDVEIEVDASVMAPLVPVSLYNGILLNLFSNALKAVTAKAGTGARRIAFRAWNEQESHRLEVSDSGVGITQALRGRVFDPLFTTTSSNADPLGSGMGLGLTLVKRGTESYGGRVEVVDPPSGFATCLRVTLPLAEE